MAKQVKFTERDGEKYIAKKSSWIKKVKIIFWSLTFVWFAMAIMVPLKIKDTYSEPIKKSMVVSMFFDLQQGIADQYAKLMSGIKKSINLEKPINAAIKKVKLAEKPIQKVQQATGNVNAATDKAQKISGLAGKLGINTKAVDKTIGKVDNAVAKVDNTTDMINAQLDKIEQDLVKFGQTEFDAMIDNAVREQLDKATGGMSNVLLTKYNVKSIAPWRPNTWSISNKIFSELEQSSKSTVQIIMATVNKYFDYVAWGIVAIVWAIALFLWFMVNGKVKMMLKPFIVCPNCGHAFTDMNRITLSLAKIFQPWKWF